MNYIVQDVRTRKALEDWCSGRCLEMLSFFFWDLGSTLQKTVQGLLRSLLYQVLKARPQIFDDVSRQNLAAGANLLHTAQAWTVRRLISILDIVLNVLLTTNANMCFFLDGLDEFDGERSDLLSWITTTQSRPNVKFCISSRPEEPFRSYFAQMPQLRLQDLTRDDRQTFIHDRLEVSLLAISSNHVCNEMGCQEGPECDCPFLLMDSILEKSSGVFLWVRIVVRDILDSINMGDTVKEVQQQLHETPPEIEDLYAHILRRLSAKSLVHTRHYFSIALGQANFLEASLSVFDFAFGEESVWVNICSLDKAHFEEHAIRELCSTVKRRIESCCAGLLEIDESDEDPELMFAIQRQKVTPMHRTVVDFFKKTVEPRFSTSRKMGASFLTRSKIGQSVAEFYHTLRQNQELGVVKASQESGGVVDSGAHTGEVYGWMPRTVLHLITQAHEMEQATVDDSTEHMQFASAEALDMVWTVFKMWLQHDMTASSALLTSYSSYWKNTVVNYKPLTTLQFDIDLEFWTFFGFHRALGHITDYPKSRSIDWTRIMSCAIAGAWESTPVIHKSYDIIESILAATLARGPNTDVQFLGRAIVNISDKNRIFVSFYQSCWILYVCMLVLRKRLNPPTALTKSLEHTAELIKQFLDQNFDPNKSLYVPFLTLLPGSGWETTFIVESSLVSFLEAAQDISDWAKTCGVLQCLLDRGAERVSRIRFFYDRSTGALFELDKTLEASLTVCMGYGANSGAPVGWPDACKVFWKEKQITLPEAVQIMKDNLGHLRRLGTLDSGVVIGDESTYDVD